MKSICYACYMHTTHIHSHAHKMANRSYAKLIQFNIHRQVPTHTHPNMQIESKLNTCICLSHFVLVSIYEFSTWSEDSKECMFERKERVWMQGVSVNTMNPKMKSLGNLLIQCAQSSLPNLNVCLNVCWMYETHVEHTMIVSVLKYAQHSLHTPNTRST